MSVWHWEPIDTTKSGSSGDLAKLFRNERVKTPGVIADGAPSPDATVLAREVIQNSWDAARDLQLDLQRAGEAPPDFDITFRFEERSGAAKRDLADVLGLAEHAERASRLDRPALGLAEVDCLAHLDSEAPLRTLTIVEHGTTGMYGSFRSASSKLFLALVYLGVTIKAEGAGGSFGYGKAGLIRGSRIHEVTAYTCFRERQDDEGVTRRLLGMSYWGFHELDGITYSGFARLGKVKGKARMPYENEAADDFAIRLGLEVRDPSRTEDLGSTFLLVDPGVEPEDLVRAIERNWWPALVDPELAFHAVVVTPEGREIHPRPKSDPALLPFVRGLEIATVPQDNRVLEENHTTFQRLVVNGQSLLLGDLGLTADISGWSYPAQSAENDELDHRSLVALVRGPRMVVEYLDSGGTMPYVRGTFVADPQVDDLLRQTEPKGHDAWETSSTLDAIDPTAPVVAKAIGSRIRHHVNAFRATLRPPTPDPREVRLPDLQRLFKDLLQGDTGPSSKPPPPGPPRSVAISVVDESPQIAPDAPDRIRLHARIGYRLTEHYADGDDADVVVRIRYQFLEDDRAGEECRLDIVPPVGFIEAGANSFAGRLGRELAIFEVVSEPYHPDWSGRLVAEGELAREPISSDGTGHDEQ